MTRQQPETLADLQLVLADPQVLMLSNIYSVIFDFSRNRLWLASGEIPAAAGGHRRFNLF